MRNRGIAAAIAIALAAPIAAGAHVNGDLHTHDGRGGGFNAGFGTYNGGFGGAPTPAHRLIEGCPAGLYRLCEAVTGR